MGAPRQHHLLPRFYLRGFADGESITTVELPGQRRFTTSVRRTARVRDYYALSHSHAQGAAGFENALSRLESDTAPILRRVCSGEWPLSTTDRDVLASFLTMQYMRTDHVRELLEQAYMAIVKADIAVDDPRPNHTLATGFYGRTVTEEEEIELKQALLDSDEAGLPLPSQGHILNITEQFSGSLQFFRERPWRLATFRRHGLITSDTPVMLLHGDPDHVGGSGLGIRRAGRIIFPLDRRNALFLDAYDTDASDEFRTRVVRGEHDLLQRPTTTLAKGLNMVTAGRARRWLYHHPEDIDCLPPDLPEPGRNVRIAVTLSETTDTA